MVTSITTPADRKMHRMSLACFVLYMSLAISSGGQHGSLSSSFFLQRPFLQLRGGGLGTQLDDDPDIGELGLDELDDDDVLFAENEGDVAAPVSSGIIDLSGDGGSLVFDASAVRFA